MNSDEIQIRTQILYQNLIKYIFEKSPLGRAVDSGTGPQCTE